MEEVTGTSVKGAIYSDPEAAFDYALELGERFKEGEEAILTSPKYAAKYAYYILERRWPRAEPEYNRWRRCRRVRHLCY